jgi:hypothetical protein
MASYQINGIEIIEEKIPPSNYPWGKLFGIYYSIWYDNLIDYEEGKVINDMDNAVVALGLKNIIDYFNLSHILDDILLENILDYKRLDKANKTWEILKIELMPYFNS